MLSNIAEWGMKKSIKHAEEIATADSF